MASVVQAVNTWNLKKKKEIAIGFSNAACVTFTSRVCKAAVLSVTCNQKLHRVS